MAGEIEREGRQQAGQLLGNRRAYYQVWALDSMIASLGIPLCAAPTAAPTTPAS